MEVWSSVPETLCGLGYTKSAREVIATVTAGLSFLDREGVTVKAPVVMLQAPLRHDLVRVTDGVILYSDRAFRLLPIERAFRFHRLPILRAVFGHLMMRRRVDIEPAAARQRRRAGRWRWDAAGC